MAYVEKYSLEFGDDPFLGNTWKIEIHQDGYVGAVTDVIAEGKPADISWKGGDLFEPIRSSEATINFLATSDFQWSEFFAPDEFEYICKIYKNGSLYWEGVNIVENYSEAYILPPYPVKLRFSDGLGNLKYVKFEDSGLITGIDTLLNIVIFCLEKLPYSKNIIEITNVLEDSVAGLTTDNLYNTTYVDKSAFRVFNEALQQEEGMMCLDVLREILISTGCTIFQSDNKWHIKRIEELVLSTPYYIEYTAGTSTIAATGSDAIRKTVTNNKNTGLLWINRDAEMEISTVFSEIMIDYQYAPPINNAGELIYDTMKPGIFGFNYWLRTADYSGSSYSLHHTFKTSVWPDNSYLMTRGLFDGHHVIYPWNGTSYQIPLDEVGGSVTYQDLFTTTNDTSVFRIQGTMTIDNHFPTAASYNNIYELGFWMEVTIGTYKARMTVGNNPTFQWVTTYGGYIVPPFPHLKTNILLSDYDGMWYGSIPSETYDIVQFTWISGTTVRIDIDNNPTFVDITTSNQLKIVGANNPIHNGLFDISAISVTYDYIDILNPDVTDNTNNEYNSPALAVRGGKLTTTYSFNIALQFPAFPENGVHDLTVKMYTPINPLLNNEQLYLAQLELFHISYVTQPDNQSLLNYISTTSINTDVRDNKMTQSLFLADPPSGAGNVKKSFKVKPGVDYLPTDQWYQRTTPLVLASAIRTLILDPHIRFFSLYRRKLRGTFFGEFNFYNTIYSTDLKTYLQNALIFNIKSGEYNVDLIELTQSYDPTDITNIGGTVDVIEEDDGLTPDPDPPTPDYDQEQMKTTQGQFTEKQFTGAMSIAKKASPIVVINDSGSNGANYNNYPA